MMSQGYSLHQQLADFLRFTGRQKSSDNTVFILVLGMTGSGKSTFIQNCTGKTVEIGHGLQSCTNDLSVHSFFLAGQHIHLIDTPGFDDTSHSDIDTLKTCASYLSASYANGVRLGGIVYLHRISDNRLGRNSLRSLQMFRKLSGPRSWPNTVIGTTMWSTSEYSQGVAREKELSNDPNYFGKMLAGGAGLFRIAEHGTGLDEQKRSSLRVIARLLKRTQIWSKIELRIQRELVTDGRMLDDTAAGKEALGTLYDVRLELRTQLESTRRDIKEAIQCRDAESVRQLKTVESDFTRKLGMAKKQAAELKTSLVEMHDTEVQRLQDRLDELGAHQREQLRNKQKKLDDMGESPDFVREQSVFDEARWRKQSLRVVALEREMTEVKEDLRAVRKAKGVLRASIVNGLASGLAAAGATVATILGTESYFSMLEIF
ncbi:hypothetical protein HBI75_207140 [Parastagonospora nodorum]|nr:hypothetical protein HBH43_221820 [Parastagonospora nodorum]KAH5010082.1 hypothetical protein HBI75_207140 [Parastagonospora nodorum]